MWFVLDLIIVAIILFYVLTSAKRGFVRTAVELAGFALSIYLAFTLGGMLSQTIYDGTVEPAIVEAASEAIGDNTAVEIDTAVDKTWDSIPDFVKNLAGSFDITDETLKSNIKASALEANNTDAIAQSAAETIAEPVVVPLIQIAIGILLFAVLMFVVKILAKIINRAFNLPIIGGLNKTLGAVLGLGKGIVVAAVIVIVISAIVSFSSDGFLFFTKENIDKSMLFGFLANFSPLK